MKTAGSSSRLLIFLVTSVFPFTAPNEWRQGAFLHELPGKLRIAESLHAAAGSAGMPADFMVKIHDGNSLGLAVTNVGEFGC